jgi:DNA polymerase III delta subunit
MISSGKRRILVDAREPSLVPDLIDSLRGEFPGTEVLVHDDVASFASDALNENMFSSGNWRILVLWDLVEDGLKSIEPLVGTSNEDAYLFVQRKTIAKSRLYTNFKAWCETLTLEPFDDRACEAYVSSILKRRSCDFTAEVPSALVAKLGRDLPALKCESKKLSLLGRRVDRDVVARAVRGRSDVRIFDFADAILRRRWAQACSMASVAPEGDLIGLLHIVQTQCQKIYKAAMLKEQGMAPDDVATMLEVPPYVAKNKIIPLANQMGRQRVLKMLDVVHATDVLARTSRLPKRILMESVVIKLLKS